MCNERKKSFYQKRIKELKSKREFVAFNTMKLGEEMDDIARDFDKPWGRDSDKPLSEEECVDNYDWNIFIFDALETVSVTQHIVNENRDYIDASIASYKALIELCK